MRAVQEYGCAPRRHLEPLATLFTTSIWRGRFHGVFDRYELYDIRNDPGEMNNLVGDYYVTTQAMSNDIRIRAGAKPEIRAIFDQLSTRLDALLNEIGCRPEPQW